MAAGKVVGAGCLALFALPFLIASSVMLYGSWRSHDTAGMIFGGVFLLIVVAIFGGLASGIVKTVPANISTAQQVAGEPWRVRTDWSAGRIQDRSAQGSCLLWPMAIFWNAIVWFAVYKAQIPISAKNPVSFVMLLFPLVGIALLVSAIRMTWRQARFGVPVCQLERVPVLPGQTMRGTIEVRGDEMPQSAFRFTVTGARDTESSTQPWQEEHITPAGAAIRGASSWQIPFEFQIPEDARPNDASYAQRGAFLWRLTASADEPGINYRANFELPVFASVAATATATALVQPDYAEHAIPPDSGIAFGSSDDGALQITVTPSARASVLVAPIVFLLFWYGVAVAFFILGHAHVFPIVFGLFGLLILYGMLDSVFARSTIRVHRNGIDYTRAWRGTGKWQTLDGSKITAIVVRVGTRSGRTVLYDVHAVSSGQKDTAIARYIWGRDNAETVAARVWKALDHSA